MKGSDSPLLVDGSKLLPAVAANVPLLSAFPAWPIFDVDGWMKAFELLMLLSAVGAFTRSFGASASPTVASATWVASVARVPSVPLDECDKVVPGHGLEI